MRPLDPRLLRHASSARTFLAVGALLGLAQTLVVIAFSWLLSQAIVGAVSGRSVQEVAGTIAQLAAVVIVRAALVWLVEMVAQRGAARVKSQLRARVLDTVAARGPGWLAGRQASRLTTVVTTGLDALDNYFARYLPQLLLSVIATPVILAVVFVQDLASGITLLIVLPLIPVFMVLIGLATQAKQRQQWEALQRLSAGFLDLVGGLGTLKIYGRERRQGPRLVAITEDYRTRTMTVLRVSFLSGFVLEMAASLSVAIVAVSIGLRLVEGTLAFSVGLFVLLLAPEVLLPVRQVGAQFHAAADGLAAAEEVFAILDGPGHEDVAAPGGAVTHERTPAPVSSAPPAAPVLRFVDLTVRHGTSAAVLFDFSAEFRGGELSVITGPSGAGKSTLLAALLGFVPFQGTIELDGRPLAGHGPRDWLAWSGQRPGLFAGTVASNVALGAEHPDRRLVLQSLGRAGLTELDPDRELGTTGNGLSGGQAQRVAAARALYRAASLGCQVVVLDEPSSALDEAAETALLAGLEDVAREGRIVVVVSHRPAFLAASDHTVHLGERVHV